MGFKAAIARAECTHLTPGNPALDSWSQHRMWVGVGSLLVPMGFSPGTLTKPTFPNSNLT